MGNSSHKRSIVVVLGMHRSGTSLLANLLTILGVDLGQHLLPANTHNEAGYWEQTEIYQTHEALLQYLGRDWAGPGWSNPFPLAWPSASELRPFKEQLITIVKKEMAQAKGVWGFKDPRTSRLLPLWKEIFVELEIEPLYLLAVREPSAVTESIVKRDRMATAHAELLWLLHNLDAVRDTGNQLRLVVDYDRWFQQPREQAQAIARALDLAWPESAEKLVSDIQQRIRSDLRHCQTSRSLSIPFVAETFAALSHAARTEKRPTLSEIQKNVSLSLALCAPWMKAVKDAADSRYVVGVSQTGRSHQAAAFPLRAEFDEARYLSVHQDVAEAIRRGECESGWDHFVQFGFAERRCWFQREGLTTNPAAPNRRTETSPASRLFNQ